MTDTADTTIAALDAFGAEFAEAIRPLADEQAIRAAQAAFLGKKGKVAELMKGLGKLPPADRPRVAPQPTGSSRRSRARSRAG